MTVKNGNKIPVFLGMMKGEANYKFFISNFVSSYS